MKNISTPEQLLNKYWGHTAFRELQSDIINSVVAGKDSLAILPTGGGKSVCFQIPGLMMEGVTLVISPLIALMKDQVYQLQSRGIAAEAIYSGLTRETITHLLNEAIDGKIKFLYISPERLQTSLFSLALQNLKIGLLAVDEAHCISKWGYDFRPAYLDIATIKEATPDQTYPTIALTATATEEVRNDIIEKLQMKQAVSFVKSFARPNLSYRIQKTEAKEDYLFHFLKNKKESGIVYAKTRKKIVELANFLLKNGISADFYHAGLSMTERNRKQEEWIGDKIKIMVATNAFGMGIDKANVRKVIHTDLCDNLEAYYQESGRGGRDGLPADALLLYNDADILTLEKNLERKYPPTSFLKQVYQSLANYFKVSTGDLEFQLYDFDLYHFASTFAINMVDTHYALKILESQGFIYLSDSYFQPAKFRFIMKAHELNSFQERNKQVDEFIKTLLRVYGSDVLFNYSNFFESEVISAMHSDYTTVMNALEFLIKQKVIDFVPQKSSPQFGFIQHRYNADRLPLNHKELSIRKATDRKAMKAMINYAEQHHRCRMNFIQDYFDEKKLKRCGKCDVCLEQDRHNLNDFESVMIKAKILSLLPTSLVKIKNEFDLDDREKAIALIKYSLSNEEFKMDNLGLIYLSD